MPVKVLAEQAAATAARLRLAQASLSDEKVDSKEYLSEIVERDLRGIAGADRAAFIAELIQHFPVWGDQSATPPVSKSVTPPQMPETATECMQVLQHLPTSEREKLIAQMGKAGWLPTKVERPPATIPADMQQAAADFMRPLGISELDGPRVFDALRAFLSFATQVEQVSWNTWKAMNPAAKTTPVSEIKKKLLAYLQSDPAVTAEDFDGDLRVLRKLIAALLAAIGHAGHQLAREQFSRYSPEAIRALVDVESGGLLTSKEVRCWRKYSELVGQFNEAKLEMEIRETLAAYAQALMKSARR